MKATDFPLVRMGSIAYRDITGHRFGRLTVLSREKQNNRTTNGRHRHWWRCLCDCGNIFHALLDGLVRDHVQSCGCLGRFRNRLCPVIRAVIIDHRVNTTKSTSQIGAYFGVTKGSVIGILDRAGMIGMNEEIIETPVREPIWFPPHNQCVYPDGTPGEVGFKWCCAPVKTGSSYCLTHHHIVYIDETGKKPSSIETLDLTSQRFGKPANAGIVTAASIASPA